MTPATQISVPLWLRAIRALLRRLNIYLTRRNARAMARRRTQAFERSDRLIAAGQELRRLDVPDPDARAYFETHLPRLARTLALVPPPMGGRILELGCYMQLTPFLQQFCGYREVRGANFGRSGNSERKSATVGGECFNISIDLFDAERDRFPFADGYFDTVLACELIEHLQCDPMHMLLECRRVLQDGARLLVTTPNVASLTSVARALHGYDNCQIYSKYPRPRSHGAEELPHVREYTPYELRNAIQAAGFQIESLFTEGIAECAVNLPMWDFLEEHGYNTALRGEQIYCVANKRADASIVRYPDFLYAN